ncbi:hypothetical protein SISSUDRAFT_1054496 [Sistotremastrum suecicum HHB10207 ss-3]|uniref:Secreted protein n=1 Tax=Sistotremastrum suecicum HHB10207 ss-3 TaxID=1314776 RepID=A0A165YGW0_9AGAM|nr:hypothetical protein SISSUDRAFT_1054496 [Sistotremastrum suecicum HHB10207 ss-3]
MSRVFIGGCWMWTATLLSAYCIRQNKFMGSGRSGRYEVDIDKCLLPRSEECVGDGSIFLADYYRRLSLSTSQRTALQSNRKAGLLAGAKWPTSRQQDIGA